MHWKKVDIASRALLLAAILLQLVMIGQTQQIVDDGPYYYLMENQANMAQMISFLDGEKMSPAEWERFNEARGRLKYWSEYEGSPARRQNSILNIVFTVMYLLSSVGLLWSRHAEINQKEKSQ